MSYHLANIIQNEVEIGWWLTFKKSMSIRAIRLKLMKWGFPDGVFTLSLHSDGQLLTSVAITGQQIQENIQGTYFNGYILFDLGEKALQINVPEGDYLDVRATLTATDHTDDEENKLALVYEIEQTGANEYESYYGIEIYEYDNRA